MKKIKVIAAILFTLFYVNAFSQTGNADIGKWRDHLSYYFTGGVAKVDDRILAVGQSSLFYYDVKTKQMEKLTKVNGLSDAGISTTEYDSVTKSTVITYENSNIDILQNNTVYNIPDIKNRAIEGSKSINHIYFYDNKAYLSCGFGVVVLDLLRHEIYDTWYLGDNSSAIKVNCIYINDTAIFAGTVNGLLYADKNSKTLATGESWKNKNLFTDNKNKEINHIVPLTQKDLLLNILYDNSSHSALVKYDGQNIDTVDSDSYVVNMKRCGDYIGIINYLSFSLFDTNMNSVYYISDEWYPINGVSLLVKDFVIDGTSLWLSHTYSGLIHLPDFLEMRTWDREIIFPDGPKSNDVYGLTFDDDGRLYVAPGGKNASNENKINEGNAYIYDGFYWKDLDKGNITADIYDVLKIAIDPRNKNHLMMSTWWNGIVEVLNDTIINIYDSSNTGNLLQFHGYNYRIAGIGYDRAGNLFAANSLVPYGFVYLTSKNEWGNFFTASYIPDDEIRGMTLDYFYSYKLIHTVQNKILVINNQGEMTIINPNNGSLLQTSQVNCLTQDKNGEIWVGTEKGIKVIYSLYDAFNNSNGSVSNVECNNIVYSENGIAQYLLSFEYINCIMVDGANRKWIGTERNGIYVLSENGDKEIYHFTLENSPLLSNKITCMAQNPKTGEVFIGTDRGLMSYRAESLEPETKDISLTVFPNPVRPDYDGLIAIKGFVNDSDVRITDAKGRMVAHLKSLGGQAVWDGRNFKGQKVASGVYFVFASANEGENTTTGKFLIIR
ncbi:MAG: hypothetical protein J6P44_05255 [Bacteroidales bacterium]|nr:hypothetical protein [Bacteroidales bacterium]